MKKLVLIMLFMLCQVLAVAKTAYIMVPEGYSDLYVIGMDEDKNKYTYNPTMGEVAIEVESLEYYDEVKLLKITMDTEKDIKLVIGYKYSFINDAGNTEEKIIVLASEEIDYDELHKNYINGDEEKIIKFDGSKNYSYLDFPGHEAKENVIVLGTKVGDKRSKEEISDDRDEYDIPKNIVEKFYLLPVAVEEEVVIDAGINPNNSADELMIRDSQDNILITMKGWEIPNPDKKNKTLDVDGVMWLDDGLNENNAIFDLNDKIIVTENKIYLDKKNGGIIDIYSGEKGPYKISFRTMNKKNTGDWSTVKTGDDEPERIKGAENFSFENVKNLELEYFKKNHFDLLMGAMVKSDETVEEKPPVYVIEGEGLSYEADVKMTSGNNNSRKRSSNIEIDIISGKGIEIKSIKE